MPDFNKGDFTQQGVNGHVNATVRLNEKRLVKIDLTSNEEDEGCTISGSITDLLNNIVYPLETPPGLFDYLGKDTVLLDEKDFTYMRIYLKMVNTDRFYQDFHTKFW